MQLPLTGVRIIEFGFLVAGPFGPRLLGELGAEIIKVESVRRMDGYRPGGGFDVPSAQATLNRERSFTEFNRNKLSLALNLTTSQGQALMRRLVRISDVVVENYSAGVLERWGLGWDVLSRLNPGLILVDLQGMGFRGPHASFVTWGPSLMAYSGMTHLWTREDAPEPVGSQTAHPDYVAGIHCALAVLGALNQRLRTGRGQRIEVAQIEGAASLLGPVYMDALVNDAKPKRLGNRSPYFAPHGCYPCRARDDHPTSGGDRWCVIAVTSEGEWESFCRALGDPPWCREPRFADLLSRYEQRDELDVRVAEWTRQRSPQEVMETLQAAGVPAAAVQDGRDLNEDPHLRQRGYLLPLAHPQFPRDVVYPGLSIRLSASPGSVRRPAPALGHDNAYIAGELLGLAEEEMAALVEAEVLV